MKSFGVFRMTAWGSGITMVSYAVTVRTAGEASLH